MCGFKKGTQIKDMNIFYSSQLICLSLRDYVYDL